MGSSNVGGRGVRGHRGPSRWSQERDSGEPSARKNPPKEVFFDAPRARLFVKLLAAVFLVAFVSLGVQVHVLIGADGLVPISDIINDLTTRGIAWWRFPTHLWLATDDGMISYGVILGAIFSILALLGIKPRLMFCLLVPLYLSYVTACTTFLSFQWDNLLLECGVLAIFLSVKKPNKLIQFLFTALLFKLYLQSGVAKWQSHLADWQDGSAMSFYYETAPIPTWLAYYAHQLPVQWHDLESRLTLVLELIVPALIFGPRWARLIAFVFLSGFQIVNIATANYGFFAYLALALHVFILDDSDIHRVRSWLAALFRRPTPGVAPRSSFEGRLDRVMALPVAVAWFALSLYGSAERFASGPPAWALSAAPAVEVAQTFRLVNTYHLFAAITTERIEPEFQTFDEGEWTAHAMHYKPGPVDRAPPFVAPHQPRVDFRLWFYGLSFSRGTPPFVDTLMSRLCYKPDAVQSLFVSELPAKPSKTRIVFWRYGYASPEQKAESGDWWVRTQMTTKVLRCKR